MKRAYAGRLAAVFGLLLAASVSTAQAAKPTNQNSTVVVTAASLESDKAAAMTNDKWFFYDDEHDQIDNSLGSFVTGPSQPPAGLGSAQISVSGSQRRNLATYQFRGTVLSTITTLKFSTFNPSAGNGGSATRSGYLNFNVDFDGSDTWQRRLVFLPTDNGTIHQDQWDEWDAIQGGAAKWRYSGATWPVTGGSGNTPKTWNQILADYPSVRVRVSDSWLGIRVGEPYANGYTENIDAFKFGTTAGTTTFDFEPGKDACMKDGWKNSATPAFKNQGDCVSYVATGGKSGGNSNTALAIGEGGYQVYISVAETGGAS